MENPGAASDEGGPPILKPMRRLDTNQCAGQIHHGQRIGFVRAYPNADRRSQR